MTVLIAASLLTAGLATAPQSVGVWKVGARLPFVNGVTFASAAPILAILSQRGADGPGVVYGSVLITGALAFFAAPTSSRLVRFFPPLVNGSVITLTGISLLPVAVQWIVGQDSEPTRGRGRHRAQRRVRRVHLQRVRPEHRARRADPSAQPVRRRRRRRGARAARTVPGGRRDRLAGAEAGARRRGAGPVRIGRRQRHPHPRAGRPVRPVQRPGRGRIAGHRPHPSGFPRLLRALPRGGAHGARLRDQHRVPHRHRPEPPVPGARGRESTSESATT